jgi:hypothetical protein
MLQIHPHRTPPFIPSSCLVLVGHGGRASWTLFHVSDEKHLDHAYLFSGSSLWLGASILFTKWVVSCVGKLWERLSWPVGAFVALDYLLDALSARKRQLRVFLWCTVPYSGSPYFFNQDFCHSAAPKTRCACISYVSNHRYKAFYFKVTQIYSVEQVEGWTMCDIVP